MTALTVDSVFNGLDDSLKQTVDLPMAYLRFLSSIPHTVGWLDSSYEPAEVTSNQYSIIEDGLSEIVKGANGVIDINRVATMNAYSMMLPGFVAMWPGYQYDNKAADIGPGGLHLNRIGTTAFNETGGRPALLSSSAMGEASYWYLNSNTLEVTGVESGMVNPGLTVLSWVYVEPSPAANRPVLSRIVSGNGYQLYINTLRQVVGGVNSSLVVSDPVDSGWHHVCFTWSPGYRMAVFVDGQLDGEQLSGVPNSITPASRTLYACYSFTDGLMSQGATVLCRSPLSDAAILYHHIGTRGMYG